MSSQVATTPGAARAVRRIQPSKGLILPDLHEIWQYKELLYYLLWRDVKARYKQTFLGSFWAIFRPLIQMVMMTVVFNQIAGLKGGNNVEYPLFVFCGNLGWAYFASCFSSGSSALVGSAGLISKAYFPRLFVPLASVMAPLVDFVLGLPILVLLFVYYAHEPTWSLLTTPLFVALIMLIGLGTALWLAPVTVRYRDISFALPFVLQIWFYATPVVYTAAQFKEKIGHDWVLKVNPMAGVTEWFRWSLIGHDRPAFSALIPSVVIMVLLVGTGLFNFRRAERTLVDVM